MPGIFTKTKIALSRFNQKVKSFFRSHSFVRRSKSSPESLGFPQTLNELQTTPECCVAALETISASLSFPSEIATTKVVSQPSALAQPEQQSSTNLSNCSGLLIYEVPAAYIVPSQLVANFPLKPLPVPFPNATSYLPPSGASSSIDFSRCEQHALDISILDDISLIIIKVKKIFNPLRQLNKSQIHSCLPLKMV
jgi:hypothetical protein